jgi:hypothetical protein
MGENQEKANRIGFLKAVQMGADGIQNQMSLDQDWLFGRMMLKAKLATPPVK